MGAGNWLFGSSPQADGNPEHWKREQARGPHKHGKQPIWNDFGPVFLESRKGLPHYGTGGGVQRGMTPVHGADELPAAAGDGEKLRGTWTRTEDGHGNSLWGKFHAQGLAEAGNVSFGRSVDGHLGNRIKSCYRADIQDSRR